MNPTADVSPARARSNGAAAALPPQPWSEEILNVLSNVLFPVVVFLIWAAATTVGTVIKQNLAPQQYYDAYPPALANIIVRLHLTNVFHSVPYIALVVLLLASMAVCTFRRVIPKRFPKDRAVPISHFGLHARYDVQADAQESAERATRFLRTRGFRVRPQIIDGAYWLFADKQKWARYGVLVAHLGFVIISFGVFLGWLRGFSGQLLLYQGDSVLPPHTDLRVTLQSFHADFIPVHTPDGVMYQAAKFQSDVRFDDANGTRRAQILVNHPFVSSQDVYFYQASYTFGGHLQVTRDGKILALPGTDGRLSPQDAIFLPGTSRAIQYGTLLGPSDPSQTPLGVALPAKDEYAIWIFHDNIPTTAKPILLPVGSSVPAGEGYVVTALPPIPATGLTYRYDPGQGWVGLGCIILVAGFVMALFFVPVKLYARVGDDAGEGALELAATTTKGNTIYEDEFKRLITGMRSAVPERVPPGPHQDEVKAYA
ncbi:MAG: cytochrome c biogenesis protein ResB [Candidatus Eremiobacteraeota bacterium]|nr:cytochrome c biogenesis protein ResB [Candidatus Eremiobacteraeota bacterium]